MYGEQRQLDMLTKRLYQNTAETRYGMDSVIGKTYT
jgi:hypothetical protein